MQHKKKTQRSAANVMLSENEVCGCYNKEGNQKTITEIKMLRWEQFFLPMLIDWDFRRDDCCELLCLLNLFITKEVCELTVLSTKAKGPTGAKEVRAILD